MNSTESYAVQLLKNPGTLEVVWLCGIILSSIGLLFQMSLYTVLPSCRKYDEKLLTQITLARILNTICEYQIVNLNFADEIQKDLVYALYFHSDMALLFWMFLFTKNLYDKIVLVFTSSKNMFIYYTLIWVAVLPASLLCPVLMKINTQYFIIYYNLYAHIKFLISIANAFYYVEIFRVAFRKDLNCSRSFRVMVKSCVIAFTLVSISCLQVLTTDLLSYFLGENEFLVIVFCVINSYQALAPAVIFLILSKNSIKESMVRTVTINLKVV